MKQQKAKYYAPKNPGDEPLIIPIEEKVSLLPLDEPVKKMELSGTDELGDYIIINFVHDKPHFFDYTVRALKNNEGRTLRTIVSEKEISESEWENSDDT